MHLFHEIRSNIDKNRFVSCIFIDLRKAFDTVNHQLLIQRLQEVGVRDSKTINIFRTYLEERIQKVKINEVMSDGIEVTCGVPQGSILGPLLFNIFINDAFYMDLNGYLQMYADDMVLVYSSENIEEIYNMMQTDLRKIDDYLTSNLMKINTEKTNYLIFNTKNKFKNIDLNDYSLILNGDVLDRVDHSKFLGLIIDSQMDWSDHIHSVMSKINSASYALRKLNKIMPRTVLWHFYNACIMSHVSYLNPVWNTAGQNKLHSLKICINRSIKIILQLPRLYPTIFLYNSCRLPLEMYNTFSTIFLIFKIKNHLIKSHVTLNYIDTNTRQKNNFFVESVRTATGAKNIFINGLKMYNKLPNELKTEKSISGFKSKLKKYLFENNVLNFNTY